MSLPKIKHLAYTTDLPTGKKVSFRPYTLTEEKILLTGKEGGDDFLSAAVQVVQSCVTDETVVGDLEAVDFEFMFIKLRGKSVDEKVKVTIDFGEGAKNLEVDLSDIRIEDGPKVKDVIEVGQGIFVKLQKPTVGQIIAMGKERDAYSQLASSIVSVTVGDEVQTRGDFTPKEALEFIMGFDARTMTKVKEFFESGPKIFLPVKYKTKDGEEKVHYLSGLHDFLASA